MFVEYIYGELQLIDKNIVFFIKCEREFRDYMKDKLGLAKVALKELLQETKLITHKSLATVKENPQHLTEIENLLTMDKR